MFFVNLFLLNIGNISKIILEGYLLVFFVATSTYTSSPQLCCLSSRRILHFQIWLSPALPVPGCSELLICGFDLLLPNSQPIWARIAKSIHSQMNVHPDGLKVTKFNSNICCVSIQISICIWRMSWYHWDLCSSIPVSITAVIRLQGWVEAEFTSRDMKKSISYKWRGLILAD